MSPTNKIWPKKRSDFGILVKQKYSHFWTVTLRYVPEVLNKFYHIIYICMKYNICTGTKFQLKTKQFLNTMSMKIARPSAATTPSLIHDMNTSRQENKTRAIKIQVLELRLDVSKKHSTRSPHCQIKLRHLPRLFLIYQYQISYIRPIS